MSSTLKAKLEVLMLEKIPSLESDIKNRQRSLGKYKREVETIKEAIRKNNEEPKVSDHALIRYIERFHGIDVSKYREEILTEERKKMINIGCKTIECGSYSFKVLNKTITTIIGNIKGENNEK